MGRLASARRVPGYGRWLKRVMYRQGLTGEQLGMMTCLSKTTIRRALEEDLLTPRTQARIARVLPALRRTA